MTPRDALSIIAAAQPFWSALALRLDFAESDAVPTAGTDGKRLLVNPAFWGTLASDSERLGVIVHEVCHVMYGHPWRRGVRDSQHWNYAADVHCNAVVQSLGWCTLPHGGIDPRAVAASLGLDVPSLVALPTETLYERIPRSSSERACSGTSDGTGAHEHGAGCPCSLTDADNAGNAEGEREQQAVRAAVVAAARQAGNAPGVLAPWLADLAKPPRVDWRAALRAYFTERVPSDYTWARPARRWAPLGLYLPALDSDDALSHVVLAVDTSGSIGTERIGAMLAACLDCARTVSARRITLVLWETDVYGDYDLSHADTLPDLSVRQGGTDVRTVFAWIDEHAVTVPSVCIVLTDLETPFPEHAPAYPVLWFTDAGDRATAPWGRTLVADDGGAL